MSDNSMKPGQRDRSRINPNEEDEMSYLSEKFAVPREQILKAIEEVGDNRQKVEEYFSRKPNP